MSEELLENQEPVAEQAPVAEEAPVVEKAAVAEELPEVEKKPRTMPNIVNEYGDLNNFDWSSLDKKGHKYDEQEKQRLEDAYTKSFKSIDEQAVIMGKVVSINSREIVVNIGFKSDGVIAASELRYNPDLKIGDEIEVYVESQEDANGQLQLSHKKARILKSWQRVNEAYDNQEIITGYVKSRTKGGLIVDVFGI